MGEENKEMGNVNENTGGTAGQEGGQGPSVEELMAELAKERAAHAKLKSSYDTAASEVAKYKKALREKQSAEEIQNEEKAKAEEQRQQYIKDLETFKQKAEAKARYALSGMSEELAMKAAEAEVSGDYDALAKVYKENTDALLKAKETEWYKNRPEPNAGKSSSSEADPFLAGWNDAGY